MKLAAMAGNTIKKIMVLLTIIAPPDNDYLEK